MRDKMAERQAIADQYPHVMPAWLPTPARHAQFKDWVLWPDGCDDFGNFLGWCPLHDPERALDGSAEFNFFKGVMRCQAEFSCHDGKRAVSLTYVVERMPRHGEG